jgi:hypothetical protein
MGPMNGGPGGMGPRAFMNRMGRSDGPGPGPQQERGWNDNRDGGPDPDFARPPRGPRPRQWNGTDNGDSHDFGPNRAN